MNEIFTIENFSYLNFQNFNLKLNKNIFYAMIGPNNSGKTLLLESICGIPLINNVFKIDNIYLNEKNRRLYLKKLGVIFDVNDSTFIHENVIDELTYPLKNLHYTKKNIKKNINEILQLLEIQYVANQKISSLNMEEKQLLIIALALIHKPKLILIDNILKNIEYSKQKFVIKMIKDYLVKNDAICIYFSEDASIINETDYVYIINNYQIVYEGEKDKIINNSNVLIDNNINLPFVVDLSIKLKMYGLVDKIFFSIEEIIETLWK